MKLYEQHKGMVYRLALSYLKSPEDAEDVCQTVFLRLIEHREKIRTGREKAWLAAVTANLCRDMLRSAQRRKTEALSDEQPVLWREPSPILEAIMELGEKERAAVYLYYYEGYSVKETAGILGLSVTAVTTRLSRAREHLRSRLEGLV